MNKLEKISEKIEAIVEREVDHLFDEESLDSYKIKGLVELNKILSVLMDRQSGKHIDEFAETTTDDLLKGFEDA